MSTGGFETLKQPDPWEGAAIGLQIAINAEAAEAEGPFRSALLDDAMGHLSYLRDREYESEAANASAQARIHRSLIAYGIHTNNLEVIGNSMNYLSAYDQYDVLFDVRAAMQAPERTDFSATEDDWLLWMENTQRAAAAEEAVAPGYGEADVYYTGLAGRVAELSAVLLQENDPDQRVALAKRVQEEFEAVRAALRSSTQGQMRDGIARIAMEQHFISRFNRVCGEAGLWQEILPEEEIATQLVYRAAVGQLYASELRDLEALRAGASDGVLEASVLLALQKGGADREAFARYMEDSSLPPFRYDQGSQVALRWADYELWATSVVCPLQPMSDLHQLESLLEVADPSFAPIIWESYAEACFEAAINDSHMPTLALELALHMTHGAFIVSNETSQGRLREYQDRARELMRLLVQSDQITVNDSKKAPQTDEYKALNGGLTAWNRDSRPYVDEVVELTLQLQILELSISSGWIDTEPFEELLRSTRIQWAQLKARQSQARIVAEFSGRAEMLLEQGETRPLVRRRPEIVVGIAPNGEPYL